MESMMQYVWQHRLWKQGEMHTNDGLQVRVIDPGLLNTDAGPDFFNAKIEIDGHMWAGNVEIHERASDWMRHGHQHDKAYDSVILHVVGTDDTVVRRTTGERIAQMVLEVSPHLGQSLSELMNSRQDMPCQSRLQQVPALIMTEWIGALGFERLHAKADRLLSLYDSMHGNWEEVCYITLARTLGFGINGEAFERLARRTPLRLLHKHSDSLLQIEAMLFGQAGMLPTAPTGEAYVDHLRQEYAFLAAKYGLQPMEREAWKLFRIRPQNFPYRRIAMLAHYIEGSFRLMRDLLEAPDLTALHSLLEVELTGYWATHYTFGKPTERTAKALGRNAREVVLINTVAPLYTAYGEVTGNEEMCDRAVRLLSSLPSERNTVVETYVRAGIKCNDAFTSQALIELKREYCEARKCIYCRIGHTLLSADSKQ